jgi:hypothetical protein
LSTQTMSLTEHRQKYYTMFTFSYLETHL